MKMIILEDVYSWLNKYGTSHIRPSSDYLIERMNDALANNQVDTAKQLLQQLRNLAGKLQDMQEVSHVLIDCGRFAYRLGSLDEAETIFVDVISRSWSDLHTRAVVQWMLGCVYWDSSKQQQAVVNWRNSLSDFERLTKQPSLSLEKRSWYEETCWKLDQNVIEALGKIDHSQEKNQPIGGTKKDQPAGVVETRSTVTEQSKNVSHSTVVTEPVMMVTSDILQLFTVSEEIPAGDFGPSGVDPFPIGKIEVDRLSIDGHPYRIYNPRGRRVVSLPSDQKITVVKVKGDSMNEENILPGDYVVLRKVEVPVNGDIVMAEIIDTDSKATLKLFYKEKNTISLQPHSSNPVHKPFIFKKIGEGFYIRGVVIAVLKPI